MSLVETGEVEAWLSYDSHVLVHESVLVHELAGIDFVTVDLSA